MARRAEAPRPQRRLRIVQGRAALGTPVLTLEEAIQLYAGLLEQTRQMDQHLKLLREQVLRAMSEMHIDSVREDSFEVMRQIRHFSPRLDEARAEELLRHFGRLQECLTTELDTERAAQVLNELHQQGRISDREMPFEYPPENDVLVVRRAA